MHAELLVRSGRKEFGMDLITAAVILAWIVLVLLAFALAGVLRQIRDIQATLQGHRTGLVPQRQLPGTILPTGDKNLSLVLLVDEGCAVCAEVTPVFAELAAAHQGDIMFTLLSAARSDKFSAVEGVGYLADSVGYHILDPGWRPAVALVDRDGEILLAEPAGSEAALRSVVDRVTDTRTRAR
ncbi:hypothetical protein [Micromonospora sp. WMMD964]|uniref:hypothetical protein n=1 Tax=Micromonospora sp. WMMD964 TaxID=3016091 RepID=UPI00249C8495|nr:hypothetical protein [Micromonospora sp. WMMD964]WFF02986.1 hypothetical protein O7616_09645 [Micromonospora sp. WMMD964]